MIPRIQISEGYGFTLHLFHEFSARRSEAHNVETGFSNNLITSLGNAIISYACIVALFGDLILVLWLYCLFSRQLPYYLKEILKKALEST